MKQTFIIKTHGGGKNDFYRLSVKKVSTAIKYLKGWREKAFIIGAADYLCRDLCAPDASYRIIETPDGYNEGKVVASGLMCDL